MRYLILIVACVVAFIIGPTIGAGLALTLGQNSAPAWSLQTGITLLLLALFGWFALLRKLPDANTYKTMVLTMCGSLAVYLAVFQVDGTFDNGVSISPSIDAAPVTAPANTGVATLDSMVPALTEVVSTIIWVVYGMGVVCAAALIVLSLLTFYQNERKALS